MGSFKKNINVWRKNEIFSLKCEDNGRPSLVILFFFLNQGKKPVCCLHDFEFHLHDVR